MFGIWVYAVHEIYTDPEHTPVHTPRGIAGRAPLTKTTACAVPAGVSAGGNSPLISSRPYEVFEATVAVFPYALFYLTIPSPNRR
jgi:hypothetical protein